MIGFTLSAILYIATSSLLMGLFPAEQLAKSAAPFADAAFKMVGPMGASIMALCAIFKAFSSLVGWTLLVNQSAMAASKDGLFLKIYGKLNSRGIPAWNFVISGGLMTLIVIFTASSSLTTQFNHIINMAVILTVLPYLYSAVAFMQMTWQDGQSFNRRAAYTTIFCIGSVYCLWVVAGSEARLVRDAMILLFLSIPVYRLFNNSRQNSGQTG
jgi:arginine:agmatine antiporter